jgi:multiple sugar transport system permease protein/raffinose/stachyose/melibiose transport system permease protein
VVHATVATTRRGGWWPFALPAALVVVLLYALPLLVNAVLAFTDWNSFHSGIAFNGLDNLATLQDQANLFNQAWLTLLYAVTASALGNVAALLLALALERPTRTNQLFRAIFFVPVLLSPLAAGYIWSGLLDPAGPVNQVIGLAVPGFGRAWLGDSGLAIFLVAAVDAWKWNGFFTLIYIAGLMSVPVELKEAAVSMGAGGWQVFRHVKLPFLAPAITFNVTVTVIGAMSAFDIIMATTRGGPGSATRVLNVLTLDQYGNGLYGLASATSLVVTVLVIVVAIPLVAMLRRREMEG